MSAQTEVLRTLKRVRTEEGSSDIARSVRHLLGPIDVTRCHLSEVKFRPLKLIVTPLSAV